MDLLGLNRRPGGNAGAPSGVIRLLRPSEVGAYKAHLLRMQSNDRRLRFAHAASDSLIDAYVSRIDWSRCFVLGYFARGVLRAALQVAWPGPGGHSNSPELAVEVEDGYRGIGVASTLMAQALKRARARGFGQVEFIAMAQNTAMLRLAQRYGARFVRSGTEVFGRFDLMRAKPGESSAQAFDSEALHSW